MANETVKVTKSKQVVKSNGGAGGLWFAGFIGALIYFIHFHSGTFWLVILAIIKALFWPAVLVYYGLKALGV